MFAFLQWLDMKKKIKNHTSLNLMEAIMSPFVLGAFLILSPFLGMYILSKSYLFKKDVRLEFSEDDKEDDFDSLP